MSRIARGFPPTRRIARAISMGQYQRPLVLGPEDWAEIDAQVTDREDPLFGGAVEERFHALHESILERERAGGKSRHA